MDTFDRDSGWVGRGTARYLMRRAGLPLLTKPHLNNHGTSSLANSSLDKLFRSSEGLILQGASLDTRKFVKSQALYKSKHLENFQVPSSCL